jgi:hypothetical protein
MKHHLPLLEPAVQRSGIVRTFTFPLGGALGVAALPCRKGRVLVVEAEVAGREPPLDSPADRGPPAPAVRVAGVLKAMRVVEPMKKRVRHRRAAYREPSAHIKAG